MLSGQTRSCHYTAILPGDYSLARCWFLSLANNVWILGEYKQFQNLPITLVIIGVSGVCGVVPSCSYDISQTLLTFAIGRYKTFFPYTEGENSPILFMRDFYITYSGWKLTHDLNTVKPSQCHLCSKFSKLLFHQHILISCQHVEKRNIDKFYCCSPKNEGVMNFFMNMWVIFHQQCTAMVNSHFM